MIVNLKSQNDLSGLYFVYYGSCNLEKPGVYGTAHLLEHLNCQAFEALQDSLDSEGVSWNAYTGSDCIVFYFTALEENLAKFRSKLMKLMSEHKITKERFENEKKIVIQEALDCFNSQDQAHYLNLSRRINNHYNAIGSISDLQKLSYEDCMKQNELQYSAVDKIINVSKTFELKTSRMKFRKPNDVKSFSNFADQFFYDLKPNPKAKLDKLNDFTGKVSVIYYAPYVEEKDAAIYQFISEMLSGGLNSPLYKEIRETRQICYYIRMELERFGKKGWPTISTVTTKKNLKPLHEALKDVLDNPQKYMTKERFNLIHNLMKINLKKRDIHRYKNVEDHISPESWNVYNLLDKITHKDVLEAYDRLISFEKFTRSLDNELN